MTNITNPRRRPTSTPPPPPVEPDDVVPLPVVTQPMPAGVEAARRVLTAVLEAGPAIEEAVTVTEALDVLLDVDPPYPPLGCQDDPTEPDVGIPAALAHLDEAAAAATSVREIARYGVVALMLQRLPGAVTA